MAKCDKHVPEPPPEEFLLRLSHTEAYTLATLIDDGLYHDGTRAGKVLEQISEALAVCGVFGAGGIALGEDRMNPDFDPEGWRRRR